MNKPIAILLATFNGGKYIDSLLDSLLRQTNQQWCCYIHDDGSSDKTVDIIQEYSTKFPEHFVLLDYPSTGSPTLNFVSMLRVVQASYYMFCDQDDVWKPEKIETSLKQLTKFRSLDATPVLVFTDLEVVDSRLRVISDSYLQYEKRDPRQLDFKHLVRKNVAAGCTMMFNCSLRNLALSYENILTESMHDWGIILIASVAGQIKFVDSPTVKYRQHSDNQVGATRLSPAQKFIQLLSGRKIVAVWKSVQLEKKMFQNLSLITEVDTDTKQELSVIKVALNKKNKFKRICFAVRHKLVSMSSRHIWRVLFFLVCRESTVRFAYLIQDRRVSMEKHGFNKNKIHNAVLSILVWILAFSSPMGILQYGNRSLFFILLIISIILFLVFNKGKVYVDKWFFAILLLLLLSTGISFILPIGAAWEQRGLKGLITMVLVGMVYFLIMGNDTRDCYLRIIVRGC
ncbi:hypothetical protein BVG98_07460 [Lacticaseibacillus rhamnosus]|nr:hypothetical protein BVG98_07460 [Lacticaseibacillus rhamnosus]